MRITEYIVGPGAYGVAVTADGAVWTSLVERGELVRLDPEGTCTHVGLGSSQCRPMVLTNGADDDLWFSRGDGFLGHTDQAGIISSRPVLSTTATPYGVCSGPEETIWYTLVDHDRIGRMTPDGATEFPVPEGSTPSMICAAGDDRLWVTLNRADALCAITLDGKLTIYPLPTAEARPVGIAASQGGVWFAEIGAGQIGRITHDGDVEEFPLPDRSSRPHAVAATRDGGCWVTLWASSAAVRFDNQGRIIDQVQFAPGAEPHGLAIAPDNSVWVALEAGSLAHFAAF